ncbi:heavy-metal-associated domain-containing protein [Flavisolibacter ginsengisoli]|jgi:copper chaperone CopZ|uniref:Copper chaperone CopZ n=1 Tax=Flavisolibacter ginsengisoli DSM 18119 TaxID=1121884 RepID=A0A1M5BHA1_9BACT|nr:cation transporter [Flavisolibacter ginsengisoli]SHF41993.1 Copper chaperone CopZ [Flavisolibacter ginsengisoli DSM 18119]
MKKLLVMAFAGMILSVGASAQTKAAQTVKLSTPTVQCEMCKKKIEEYLKRYDGVTSVNVNYKRKETTIKYLTDRTNEEVLKAAIANAGYDANEVKANPESYKALPRCCKKPEDGGGMPKH